MLKQLLAIVLKQNPWAKEVKDFVQGSLTQAEVPLEPPENAMRVGNTLQVRFDDGTVWSIEIKAVRKMV